MLNLKSGVDQTVSIPEDYFCLFDIIRGVSPQRFLRIPQDHLIRSYSHLIACVAAEVLVREKEDFLTLGECPAKGIRCIGRCTNSPSSQSAKGLQIRIRIHINDRHDGPGICYGCELIPGFCDDIIVRHVGHPASCFCFRYLNGLVGLRKNFRTFGHKMHATENNIPGILILSRLLGKTERITLVVPQGNNLFSLVMVGQDKKFFPEVIPYGLDSVDSLFIVILIIHITIQPSVFHHKRPADRIRRPGRPRSCSDSVPIQRQEPLGVNG